MNLEARLRAIASRDLADRSLTPGEAEEALAALRRLSELKEENRALIEERNDLLQMVSDARAALAVQIEGRPRC